MSRKGCVSCGSPVPRGQNLCQECVTVLDHRDARRKAEKAILYEFARLALAEPCSDGNCMLGHPGGMHTNGGCRCGRREGSAQVIWLGRLRRMLAAMAAEVYEARKAPADPESAP